MKVLFTGGSGFLGRSVIPLLKEKYEIKTLGFDDTCHYKLDISQQIPEIAEDFDIVVHAAGKAHSVPKTSNEALAFYNVNLNGTKNICTAFENKKKPQSFIFISTVAVYGCDFGENIDETHPLNGDDPYAKSKIEAEQYLEDWCRHNNVKLGILRPSLIAGKNPPGNLGAMINGIKTKKYFRIGKGDTQKSILMAQDIARLIPKLINKGGIYNVCDNHHPSFLELERVITTQLKTSMPKSIPYWLANSFAKFGDLLGPKAPINSHKLEKITKSLTFSNEKAKRDLDWEPLDVLQNFIID